MIEFVQPKNVCSKRFVANFFLRHGMLSVVNSSCLISETIPETRRDVVPVLVVVVVCAVLVDHSILVQTN